MPTAPLRPAAALAACAVLLASGVGASRALAQAELAPTRGSVTGTVLAAATGLPIEGAIVALEAAADAPVVEPPGSRPKVLLTDADGAYRFGGLPPGSYRLSVRHLGFHPASLRVDLARAVPFRVSVALEMNPILLDAIDARATTNDPYGRMRTLADEVRNGRLDAEQYREERYLEGDAAVLTHAELTESVTLGETDLFRAVQRLPGVSTRDDFTAALWTRGAPWSQTRVYFDGLPLYNPVHALGVFAGVNPDAIGVASFLPGVRSAAIGEGAAGVLDVASRRPDHAGLRGLGELSLVSGRGAVDWGSPGGRSAFSFAARRSYVDVVTRLAESIGGGSATYVPYDFYDITTRFDTDLGRGYRLEASGLLERDDVRGTVAGLLRDTRGHWGNALGRVSLLQPLGGLRLRHTIGVSEFGGTLGPSAGAPGTAAEATPAHAATRNRVGLTSIATELGPADAGTEPTWSAGLQLAVHHQEYVGQFPRPYPVIILPDSLSLRERLPVASLWAERRWGLGRYAELEAGLRADLHRPVANAGPVGLAPRLTLRATPPGTHLTLTAGLGRSWQYTQALAPAGPSIGPDLYVTDVWFLAADTVPALRADIATLGAELWNGSGWTVEANAFLRRVTGVATPEPASGPLNDLRPIFVTATNVARGVEVSLRRLVGRWTLFAAYSLTHSELRAVSALYGVPFAYASPTDRQRVFNLTAMVRVADAWRIGGAFTAARGAPFTRFQLGVAPCAPGSCPAADTAALFIGPPGAERTAAYASLDLLLDWTRQLGHARIGAYLQVRNVLNRVNAVTYTGTVTQCVAAPPTRVQVPGRPGLCDRFDRGVPLLPLVGVRVVF